MLFFNVVVQNYPQSVRTAMYIDKIDGWKIPVGLKLASLFAEILFDLLCFALILI